MTAARRPVKGFGVCSRAMPIRHLPRVLLALLTMLCCLVATAQDSCPPPPHSPSASEWSELARRAQDRGFLWTFEKDGRTSHLFGTLHAQKLEWVSPGPRVAKALRSAKVLALELDPSDAEIAQQLGALSTGPARPALPEHLRARLQARMLADCVDPQTMQTLVPELQLAGLGLVAARRDGLEAAYGSEVVLAHMARSIKKPVHSLETVAEQLRAFQAADQMELETMIDQGLTDLDNGSARRILARLAASWAASDADALTSYAAWCECVETEAARTQLKRLLDDRNPVLAERIDTLHGQSGPVFVGIGALHMFGPGNLPDLLQARGFKVTRVF